MLSRLVVSQVKHNSYFLVGLMIGLWLALAAVPLDDPSTLPGLTGCDATADAVSSSAGGVDEFEPHREERPLGAAGAAGRSVQRPRYYTTELGMRAGLLAGALSSEAALSGRAAALNATARLSPQLRFFITASPAPPAPPASPTPPRANVVAFTDTREMLKPFHALKYLADNYLEEYDFFFLVSDSSFVNARRLSELTARLSVSQDVYMGSVADDDTHYCSLEAGILLSNSVLRAIHGELDWCVRNSYSPHHHENIGRCVLHAAHLPCTTSLQGENYVSRQLEGGELGGLVPELADAVTVHPLHEPHHFYQLHAYVSRVFLERAATETKAMRVRAAEAARRHPRGARNASWPAGLRGDPGLAPPVPASRFDHLRWTAFNTTHAFMPDDHRMVGLLEGATKQAVDMVVEEARVWATKRWGAGDAELAEGAWCWEPPYALRYRLLLRLTPPPEQEDVEPVSTSWTSLRSVEVARVLGAARLAPARYVTESARVTLLLPLPVQLAYLAPAFLALYDTVCLQHDANTHLTIVIVSGTNGTTTEEAAAVASVLATAHNLTDKHRNTKLEVMNVTLDTNSLPVEPSRSELARIAAKVTLTAALHTLSRDALVLLVEPDLEFNEEFLNRVRMNTIMGEQWFLPVPFARYAQFAHPRFVDADGRRPSQGTGRFNVRARRVLAVYRSDFDAALDSWRKAGGAPDAEAAEILAASPLRALRAPEPAALLDPRPPPCDNPAPLACLRRERDRAFTDLDLGARNALAKLLLETQAHLD